MSIPFSIEQFFEVFEKYNIAVWPMHVAMYLLGIAVLVLVFTQKRFSSKIVNGVLVFFWIFMGVGYHLIFFSEINPAAKIFGGLFIIQGLLFLWFGVIRSKITYRLQMSIYGITGLVLVLYGMFIYHLLGNALGHVYPAKPVFGVAPCPTVIFTLGLMLMSSSKIPWGVLIIPVLWSFIGFSAALQLAVPEDYGLFVAGILTLVLIVLKRIQNNAVRPGN